MGYKHINWVEYGRRDDTMEIIIRDGSSAKIETFKCNVGDKKKSEQILKTVANKYGIKFYPEIAYEDSVDAKEKSIKQEKDDFKSDFSW